MIYELARQDERIVFIGSDLGSGTLDNFRKEFPERFFMEGISEANVIGMAAGLALEGRIAYVNTIASFITRRCFEQNVIDLCLHRANVRLIGNGGGLVYAPLGPTHMTVEDLAIMRALPNMTVLAPADAGEMHRLIPRTVDHPGPIYIRLAKGYEPVITEKNEKFEIGRAFCMREGEDVLLISTGITTHFALQAADRLYSEGVEVTVLHVPTLKPLDVSAILKFAEYTPIVVTIEEHSILGGLGSAVAEVLMEADFDESKFFKRIGLPDQFPEDYGNQAHLLERYGITETAIVRVVNNLLTRKAERRTSSIYG